MNMAKETSKSCCVIWQIEADGFKDFQLIISQAPLG